MVFKATVLLLWYFGLYIKSSFLQKLVITVIGGASCF